MRSWKAVLGEALVGAVCAAGVALAVGGCVEARPPGAEAGATKAGAAEAGAATRQAPDASPAEVVPGPQAGGEADAAKPPKDAPMELPPRPADAKRDIHTRGGGDLCLEMYSACDAKGLCTSASFTLSCGEIGTIPGGDTVRCVCP